MLIYLLKKQTKRKELRRRKNENREREVLKTILSLRETQRDESDGTKKEVLFLAPARSNVQIPSYPCHLVIAKIINKHVVFKSLRQRQTGVAIQPLGLRWSYLMASEILDTCW